MASEGEDRRFQERSYIEPYSTDTFLEFSLGGKEYRFSLLDTSPGGMAMLVAKEKAEVLDKLSLGTQVTMKYGTPQVNVSMDFKIMHITPIKRGTLKGHYQVGLSLSVTP